VSGYTVAWLLWGAMFVAVEGAAIIDKDPGDTLSEHVWSWFRVKDKGSGWKIRRRVLQLFMTWLSAHFVLGV